MVASSVTPTIYGLTQYTRIFYYMLLPGVRKTDYLGYYILRAAFPPTMVEQGCGSKKKL